MYISICTIYNI